MLTQFLRRQASGILEPIARTIRVTNISPNVLTVIGFLLTVCVAGVLAAGYLQVGGILMVVAAIFDAIDGTLARVTNRTSRFGAFLDSTLDRYSEAVTFFGLLIYYNGQGNRIETILIFATLIGSLLVSYTRARAEGLGIQIKSGLFTRVERVIVLAFGLIIGWMSPVLWILALLTNFTAVQRIYTVWRITGGEQGG
ncbi:CDP-alcohol phosphatidyltransferase family protein [Candidatus Amarolinea dominans]|uniref:CDP-alcohol phosphatidyltransferase family protein n=1 Tax=Candidatus Amarolinea dominans TaxID=3140696 RepID=UPI001D96AF5C|nr:CDP-alcohol phosphatidyltransferase family protein [Anaerolineae bacterium]